jgi:hypothetical protein
MLSLSERWPDNRGWFRVLPTRTGQGGRARHQHSGKKKKKKTVLLYPRSNPWDIISGGLLPGHAFTSRVHVTAILLWESEFSYYGQLTALLGERRSLQWLSGHRLAARIKAFRSNELGVSAKVILVMDSSIWVMLEVAFLAMWPDWPPCCSMASDTNATDCLGGSMSKVSMRRTTGGESACSQGHHLILLLYHTTYIHPNGYSKHIPDDTSSIIGYWATWNWLCTNVITTVTTILHRLLDDKHRNERECKYSN